MIIHDIKNHGEAEAVGAINESFGFIGAAIKARRSEHTHAVITPAPTARKIGDGHDFNHGDSELCEFFQLLRSRSPVCFGSEGGNVHLVDDLSLTRNPFPFAVGPTELMRIDNLGRAVWTQRLESRSWIGEFA